MTISEVNQAIRNFLWLKEEMTVISTDEDAAFTKIQSPSTFRFTSKIVSILKSTATVRWNEIFKVLTAWKDVVGDYEGNPVDLIYMKRTLQTLSDGPESMVTTLFANDKIERPAKKQKRDDISEI